MEQLSKMYGCEGREGKREKERIAGLSEDFSFYFIALQVLDMVKGLCKDVGKT